MPTSTAPQVGEIVSHEGGAVERQCETALLLKAGVQFELVHVNIRRVRPEPDVASQHGMRPNSQAETAHGRVPAVTACVRYLTG